MSTETGLGALTNGFGKCKVGQPSKCVIQVNMIYTILCPNSETDSFSAFIGRKATIGPGESIDFTGHILSNRPSVPRTVFLK